MPDDAGRKVIRPEPGDEPKVLVRSGSFAGGGGGNPGPFGTIVIKIT